ncbi:MFS transporter [Streptomyces sp. ASQP_92]|uniref:MFS transporter n=1 Tax=Streptomyces sp. ASQP_92 TaxID=2979116 RepID=UPI0021C22171|nr:MFS transporter [Streptomyces sp. ASQP_92]MCT9094136.1 MFS transporter [Streptomyces sp. ASQP_92]
MVRSIDAGVPGTATGREGPTGAGRWALAGLSLSMLLSSLGTSIANVGLPTLAHAFDASFQQVQWVVLAYLLAVTTLIVGVGRLGDLLGRRRLLLSGILLFTVASALCGAAPTLWLLIAGRAAQGLGAAVMMALTMAFVGETVPKERTGRAMGLLGTMSAIGTALGPSLGGVLLSGFGWRGIFYVTVPLGMVTLLMIVRQLPVAGPPLSPFGSLGSSRPAFDHVGTVLLAVALGAYALAMTLGHGHVGPLTGVLLAAAVLAGVLFVRVEKRTASPLVRPAMFRDRALSASLVMSTLVSTVMMATLVVGPFYLTRALGLRDAVVGLVLSTGPLVAAATGVPAGRVVDRWGTYRTTVAGLGASALGCVLPAVTPVSFGVLGYVVPLAVVTGGYAVFQTANNTAVMRGVEPSRRGLVSGVLQLSRNLGLVTGTAVMGTVFALASGVSDVAVAGVGVVGFAMRVTFGVGAGVVLLALAVGLGAGPLRGSSRP